MAQSLPTPPSSPLSACLDLRRRLRLSRTESEPNGVQDKRLYLESHVRQFLKRDIVRVLLECDCSRCCRHRYLQQITDPASYVSTILPSTFKDTNCDSGYVILLALLIHIECPALIYSFVDKRYRDGQLKTQTAVFTQEFVRSTFMHKLPAADAEEYADEFHWAKYKFAVPRVEGDHYEEYPMAAILPFENERRLGRIGANGEIVSEGHFGDVYSFDIIREYCHFSEHPGVRTFARKELRRNTPHGHFCEERDNLLRVRRLRDKHLIQIVKSYKHGDRYNFIFPCARTNLDRFLRDPSFTPFTGFHGMLPEHPIWEQMLGITRALHKVLEYEITDTELEKSLYGYHFDLKPANILVDWSGDLVITDFGQSRFKETDGTSSNITGMGGNESYAPPEIDKDLVVNNRKYDIWSLGCILLEVSTFVVKGREGLLNLDAIRRRGDALSRTCDDRFFRRRPISVQPMEGTGNPVIYELKPPINQWVQRLPESVPDGPSRIFISRILSIALQMLDVDVRSRLTSREVCLRLSEVIRDCRVHNSQLGNNAQIILQPSPEGIGIGTELMTEMKTISYNLEGYWNTAPVHFVQEHALLYVYVLEHRTWVPRPLGPWSQLRLLPQYTLRDCTAHSSPDVTISCIPNTSTTASRPRPGKFSTSNMLVLQEILLAQKVHKSLKLVNVSIRLKPGRSWSTFMHRKNRRGRPDALDSFDANIVQVWTESQRQDIIGPDAAMRRQSPRSLRLGPGPVRMAIFHQKQILVLRLAKNERIEPRSDSDPSSTSITIVPTDRTTDPSFPISLLRPQSGESLPGLPLSREAFEAQEMENCVECNSLKLTFPNRAEADSCQRTYKKLKKQWSEQVKDFKNLQDHIVREVGYSQST